MCISPIFIKNPYYQGGNLAKSRRTSRRMQCVHDTSHAYISVPCGKCKECVSMKQNHIVQRVEMLQLDHYCFMLTLTYNNEMLPYIDVNEYRHYHVDYKDFQDMIKRIRKKGDFPPFRYLVVSEYGHEKHRPHFHVIIFINKLFFDNDIRKAELWARNNFFYFLRNWVRNVATTIAKKGKYKGSSIPNTRNPRYVPLCTYREKFKHGRLFRNYDFHLIKPRFQDGESSSITAPVYYVTKYIMKFDKWLDKKRIALKLNLPLEEYRDVWNLIRPKCIFSHDVDYDTESCKRLMDRCITYSHNHAIENGTMCFIHADGHVSPLAPFLRNKLVSFDDLAYMVHLRHEAGLNYGDNTYTFTMFDYNNPIAKRDKANQFYRAPHSMGLDLDLEDKQFTTNNEYKIYGKIYELNNDLFTPETSFIDMYAYTPNLFE